MKAFSFPILALIIIFSGPIFAQDSIPENKSFSINGFANGSFYGLSESFDISSAYGELGLKVSGNKGNSRFVTDFRVRSGSFFGENKTIMDLKEAFAEYSSEYFEISLGKRIVKYGKATSFNPTDNVCPKDYFFLSSDMEDMQMANFMLKTNIKPANWLNIELIAIPVYTPSIYRYDLFDMNYNLSDMDLPLPPAFTNQKVVVSFHDYTLPEISFENMSYSARIGTQFSFADISLTGFHGYDPFYGFKINNFAIAPSLNLVNQAEFYKKTSLGLSLSVPAGSWLFTGEAAYNHTEDYKDSIFIPNPELYYVAGVEKDIFGIKIIGEYIGRYIIDFEEKPAPVFPTNPAELGNYMNNMLAHQIGGFNNKVFSQSHEISHAMMVTLHRDFFYETLTGDLSFFYNFTTDEKLMRAAVKWKLSDELALSAGGQFMDGPKESIFDYAGSIMSGMFFSMKYSF